MLRRLFEAGLSRLTRQKQGYDKKDDVLKKANYWIECAEVEQTDNNKEPEWFNLQKKSADGF